MITFLNREDFPKRFAQIAFWLNLPLFIVGTLAFIIGFLMMFGETDFDGNYQAPAYWNAFKMLTYYLCCLTAFFGYFKIGFAPTLGYKEQMIYWGASILANSPALFVFIGISSLFNASNYTSFYAVSLCIGLWYIVFFVSSCYAAYKLWESEAM